jgi:hypothetical protein
MSDPGLYDHLGLTAKAAECPNGGAIVQACMSLAHMLLEKNLRYGNSALDPVRVFSTASPVEQLRVRMDDKLSRLRTAAPGDDEDALWDLAGYLILLRIAEAPDGGE